MQSSSGITSDISKHLSSLRMNSGQRRQTISQVAPSPNSSGISSTEGETSSTAHIPFDPLDESSYPADLVNTGLDFIRITRRKRVHVSVRLDVRDMKLIWGNNNKFKEIDLDKIQSIRIGDDSANYRKEFNVSDEFNLLWMSIIYLKSNLMGTTLYNDLKILHLISTTKRNNEMLYKHLNILTKYLKNQESLINCSDFGEFTKSKWKWKPKDRILFDEILKLLNDLHIFMDLDQLRANFSECDENSIGSLDFEQFQQFVSNLRTRKDLHEIYGKYAVSSQMDLHAFTSFIRNVQNENMEDASISSLFEKFSENNRFLTISEFSSFLLSYHSNPLKSIDTQPKYYSRPLNEYFVSSSHNTYLLGKQFNGNSSIEGYIHVLQRGCRCIEIDVWDGPLDANNKVDYPIVTHGRSLTNSIDFKVVVDIIHKHAFISTPLPLIISLEIRCSPRNQYNCVVIMKEIFGDKLITDPIDDGNILPSPELLKHKILIKVKKSKQTTTNIVVESDNISSSLSTYSSSTNTTDDSSPASVTESNLSIKKRIVKSPKVNIIPELTLLSPYLVGLKFTNFSLPESKTFNHTLSFSDRSFKSLVRDKSFQILKHNKKCMMRIYPSIVRYKSNNFNPVLFWEYGCQMVATNWQIWDLGEELSECLFKSLKNDGIGFSGYRLKPDSLRLTYGDKEENKIKMFKALEFNIAKTLKIQIISAQQLMKPKELLTFSNGFTPWVEIEIFNVKTINASIEDKGKIIQISSNNKEENSLIKLNGNDLLFKTRLTDDTNNGFNPIFDIFCRLEYLTKEIDMTFIRFTVKTRGQLKSNNSNIVNKVSNAVVSSSVDYVIGTWSCKISDLKCGYRYLRLGDNKGKELLYSTLFIRVQN